MDFDKAYRDQYLISDASTGDPTVHVGRLFIQGLQSHPLESSLRNFAAGVLRSATQTAEELRAVNSALKFQLKPLQKFGEQVLETAEQLAAMKAWQEGDKDHLRAWIKERNGGKPDSILSAQLTNDVPPIKDDTDAGRIITFGRSLIKGHKKRLERDRRTRSNSERTQQLYVSLAKRDNWDYMQALSGYEVPPKEMLKKVLPGVVFSLSEDVPPEDLRRQVQKCIRDDNRPLRLTGKPVEDEYGKKLDKITSADLLRKEFEDELDLAFFLRMQDEQRQLNLMKCAGLTPREWQIVEFQRDLYSRAQMADMLGITVDAVNSHASNAAKKLRQASGF